MRRKDFPLSNIKEKDDIIKHKKAAIRILNDMLENYIKDSTPEALKKVDLLSYWIKDYSRYIKQEETFDSSRLPRYKRGSIVRVNFGFNVGKEFGGLHLAVVIDNDNKRNSDVITVVPLSSTDGKIVHERNVDLGVELYSKIIANHQKVFNEVSERIEKNGIIIKMHYARLSTPPKLTPEEEAELLPFVLEAQNENKRIMASLAMLENHRKEIERMKHGSMALVNQLTTISKQRIYIPKKSTDFLYGITLSSSAMDKINTKLKELYIFE